MTAEELADVLLARLEHRAVDLAECCRRLDISLATGERLVREGRFPIPELPPLGADGSRRPRRTFSTADINRYLDRAATERHAREPRRLRVASRRS